jgi:hypothetical protein
MMQVLRAMAMGTWPAMEMAATETPEARARTTPVRTIAGSPM